MNEECMISLRIIKFSIKVSIIPDFRNRILQFLADLLLCQREPQTESDIGINSEERPGGMRFVECAVEKELQVEAGRKQVIS